MIPFSPRRAIIPSDANNDSEKEAKLAEPGRGGETEMMERLLDIEVTEDGTVTEEIEVICTMTGFRRRFLIHHMGEGLYRSAELGPS